jgi:hypothetical protein
MEEITLNNEEKKTEQEFLEMAEDCMKRISDKNKELERLRFELHSYKSKIAEVYGCYKKLTKFIHDIGEVDTTIDFLLREVEIDLHNLLFHKKEMDNNQINFSISINDLMEGIID